MSEHELVSPFTDDELKLLDEIQNELDSIDKELNDLSLPSMGELGLEIETIESMKKQSIENINSFIPETLRTPDVMNYISTDIVDFCFNKALELDIPINNEKDDFTLAIKEQEIDMDVLERIKNMIISLFPKDNKDANEYINNLNNQIEELKIQIDHLKTINNNL